MMLLLLFSFGFCGVSYWLWRTRPRPDDVSAAWLEEQRRRACLTGVDLPRWRLPKERR
jgi:hypothetical protein